MNIQTGGGRGMPARLYLNGVDDTANGNLDLDPDTYEPADEPYYTASRPQKYQLQDPQQQESAKPRTADEVAGSDSAEVQAAKNRASRFLEEMSSPPASSAAAAESFDNARCKPSSGITFY